MRRALPWIGFVLLTVSFVWFLRLPPASQPRGAPRPLVVVLDPGHGGKDSGAMCGEVMEKDLALDVALRTELLLRARGYATVLTRASDRYLSLAERAAVGNRETESLFVSIHFNDGERLAASGVETYYARRQSSSGAGFFAWWPFFRWSDSGPLRIKSESLARFIQGALVERTRALNRGTKSEQFYVIANVRHPAALVEGGFITSKSDVMKLASAPYRGQIAAAISDGIERYRESLRAHLTTVAWAAAGSE